jgi:hypothetical protein
LCRVCIRSVCFGEEHTESVSLSDTMHSEMDVNMNATMELPGHWFYVQVYSKRALRLPGIEPGSPRWQRGILPLDHKRFGKVSRDEAHPVYPR